MKWLLEEISVMSPEDSAPASELKPSCKWFLLTAIGLLQFWSKFCFLAIFAVPVMFVCLVDIAVHILVSTALNYIIFNNQ